jgi:hypothetical protein
LAFLLVSLFFISIIYLSFLYSWPRT